MPTRSPHVLALCHRWRGNALVCVHNFAPEPAEVSLRLTLDGGERLASLTDEEESRAGRGGAHRIALDAYGYRWYRVGGLDYALRRESVMG